MNKPQFKPVLEQGYINNPGYLKLDLMLKGVRLDPLLYKRGDVLEKYELAREVFGNLDLVLPQETHVSVPYQEEFAKNSPYKLRFVRGKFFLVAFGATIAVKLIPQPLFYSQKINQSTSIGEVAACHGGYVSLALGGHRYLQSHLADGTGQPVREALMIGVDEVIAVLERIKKDRPIDVVALSSWTSGGEDGGVLQIEPYIRAIKNSFHVLLFVEIHLPMSTEWIDRSYAMGADSVCYHIGNLCSHGIEEEKSERQVEAELKLLKYAVSIFPPGAISSHLTMGNRPFEEVMEDIETLTRIKVLPILTFASRNVILKKGFTTAQLAPLFGFVYNASKRNKITMNWFSKLAPFIAPIEGHHFSGDSPRLKLALLNFYQSRFLGGSISAGLSNLRRRLRVKEVKK